MPIHDWSRVDPGIFAHFHHGWVCVITDILNHRLLPSDHYALLEPRQTNVEREIPPLKFFSTLESAEPLVRVKAETDLEFYRRRQDVVAIRHVSGDRLIAIVEVVSRGNKSGRKAFTDFLRKAAEFLNHGVHLLILDVQPPTSRDPQGIHGAIWDEVAGTDYLRPEDKPLTLAAYKTGPVVRAFVEPVAVGDSLIDMPLFLGPGRHVPIPVEQTYQQAFNAVPRRWRSVLVQG